MMMFFKRSILCLHPGIVIIPFL
uniref:Uncharacterized protein n=1 Tax=Arundo donax TaxID=35708 RepID=A0A0A9AWK2_ARUDO